MQGRGHGSKAGRKVWVKRGRGGRKWLEWVDGSTEDGDVDARARSRRPSKPNWQNFLLFSDGGRAKMQAGCLRFSTLAAVMVFMISAVLPVFAFIGVAATAVDAVPAVPDLEAEQSALR
jgi:hypothetical protein